MSVGPRIFIAGHRGMVGAAVLRLIEKSNAYEPVLRTREELDLFDAGAVDAFFKEIKPEYVIDAAAKVGGIHANSAYPVDFLLENLKIQNNLIEASHKHGVKKFVFLGSACIYPRLCPQPIKEEYLETGPLEPTNAYYALAKIAGIRLCQAYRKQFQCDFISVMPNNLYGPFDNFHLMNSHVMPAMIRKFHEAKVGGNESATLWGTGSALREFLHVDDCARAILFLMENYSGFEHVNVGSGSDLSIKELAEKVAKIVGFEGRLEWDHTKPDGMPRKLLDCSTILNMGWKPLIGLDEGIRNAYEWFLDNRQRFES